MIRSALVLIGRLLLFPTRCPICLDRTSHLDAHLYVNHAGEERPA